MRATTMQRILTRVHRHPRAWLATAILLWIAPGCGTVIERRQEVLVLDEGDRTVSLAGANDCNTAAGHRLDRFVAPDAGSPELHIIGLYGAHTGSVKNQAEIVVQRPGPLVLVLTAHDPTHWNVAAGEGTELEEVIITGPYAQSATVPTGVPVTNINYAEHRDMLGQAHSWVRYGDDGDDCEDFYTAECCAQLGGQWEFELQSEIDRTIELVARAEAHTGLDLTSFHGCYDMSFFTLAETRPL